MSPLAFPEQPALATKFKSLHKPGDPVVLPNVHDPPTTSLLLSQPTLPKAVATPSYAIAAINGLEDDELTLELNLRSIKLVAGALRKQGHQLQIPFTADLQSGYNSSLESAISQAIAAGVVGCNLEDVYHPDGNPLSPPELYPVEEQCSRIRRALSVAHQAGLTDFCINARTDALLFGRSLEEAIERGKAYLEAGAETVFVWGGPKRGVSRDEVVKLVEAFQGRLNVKMNCVEDGGLQVEELKKLGVARISLGPTLWRVGMAAIGKTVQGLNRDGVLRRGM